MKVKVITLLDICSFLEELKVAKFKWPERLLTIKALPRNAMNKVVRSELAKLIKVYNSSPNYCGNNITVIT